MKQAYGLPLVFILSFIFLVPWLGNKGFYTRGEPREALVMQSIINDGNWILPSGYGGVVPSKPPFMHWLAAVASLPAGEVTEFSARLPSALASVVFVSFFFVFLRRRRSGNEALLSCLILLTSIEWFRAAISARVDILLSALIVSGLLLLYEWSERDFRGLPWKPVLLFALATLTKGPVSLILPAGIFGFFLLLRGAGIRKACVICIEVFLPALLIAALWYGLAETQRPGAFSDKVYYENIQRFLGTQEDEPHKHSALNLYATVLVGFLPWTLIIIAGLLAGRPMKPGLERLKRWYAELDAFTLFSCVSFLAFVVFFSIPAGKRSVYLLPVYPFISIWVAGFILGGDERRHRWMLACCRALSILLIILYAAVALLILERAQLDAFAASHAAAQNAAFYVNQLARFMADITLLEGLLLAFPIMLAVFLQLPRGRKLLTQGLWQTAGTLIAAVISMINIVLFPVIADAVSPRAFAREIQSLVHGSPKLYSFGAEYYGLSFYLKKAMYRFEESRNASSGLVVLNTEALERFKALLPAESDLEVLKVSTYGIIDPSRPLQLVRFYAPR